MGTIRDLLKNTKERWNKLSKGRRVGIIVLSSGVIISIIFFIAFLSKPKYEPLFLNISQEDMAKVVTELKKGKTPYKLQGSSVLVPAGKVQEVRLDVISSGALPSSGKGFELFDQNKFGMTDTEINIQYQRALETELARTIQAFSEVDQAIVHLVLPKQSVFVTEQEPARASVTLKLKDGQKLSQESVKTIVALISGSVQNLPKENVTVVDNNFNYLSENLYNADENSTPSIGNRQDIKRTFEKQLESNIKSILDPVFSSEKVKVSVNADLDFDTRQTTSIHYGKDQIIKDQHKLVETTPNSSSTNSGSPIDNQTTNNIQTGTANNSPTTKEDTTTNYAVGQDEEKVIKAPGEVKRLSTSVVIDGTLSDEQKQSVANIVMAATGYVNNAGRSDLINVEGMPFDISGKRTVQDDLNAMQNNDRIKKYAEYIGYPLAAVLGLLLLLFIVSRIRASRAKREVDEAMAAEPEVVDMTENKPVAVNEVVESPTILEEEKEQKPDLTDEIKKYANKKPDQVVEIVKSWLAEDER
ncbi:MAG: flagellar basal-body MS-ring/collar protein FliF [Clostridiales bacterium]|nr:flagellar basal-body MS-ring/collar protein FliF [Clostridiales bacterium]